MQTRHKFYGSNKRGILIYIARMIESMNGVEMPQPPKPQSKRQARRNRHRA